MQYLDDLLKSLFARLAQPQRFPESTYRLQFHSQFTFRDVGKEAGLLPHVGGIAGHAVAWGDVDGSGYPSLYVGTFGGKPYNIRVVHSPRRKIEGKFTGSDDDTRELIETVHKTAEALATAIVQ